MRFLWCMAVLIAVTACADPRPESASAVPQAANDPFTPITKESEFRARIVDRELTSPTGNAIIHSDGRVVGSYTSGDFVGSWHWKDGFFCREGQLGKREVALDCLHASMNGNRLRLTRGRGTMDSIFFEVL